MNFDPKVWKYFALINQISFSMIAPILLCVFIGRWVDERFSSNYFIVFVIIGVLSGFRNLFVIANKYSKDGKGTKK